MRGDGSTYRWSLWFPLDSGHVIEEGELEELAILPAC